ncbi:MAG: hypothetical protein J5I59_02490 [Saprospiraceae bacterium]|nr:hypothetical protein [Saprospiraceae bacterium]
MIGIRNRLRNYVEVPLSHQLVSDALAEYSHPNAKISEMVRRGFLISLRRGLYVPGPEADLPIPDLFVVANHLRGPSYISLQSALSYHGLIPERVEEITSITLLTTRDFDTPIGRFTYRHFDAPYYSFGIERVQVATNQFALIASPEKAICDTIVATAGVNLRSRTQTLDYLVEDMRIDEADLQALDEDLIESWLGDAPKRSSLEMLLNTIRSI